MTEQIAEQQDNFYAEEHGVYLDLKPSREYPKPELRVIDSELAEKWIQIHPTEDGKKLAQKLLDNINILSFDQFINSLEALAEKINDQILDEDYVLLVDPESSSEYIASLISTKLDHQPKATLNIASNYFAEFESELLKGVKKIVFLDDGSFSASQIEFYIENHIRPLYHIENGRQVVIGICYSTPRARALIDGILPEGAIAIFQEHLPVLEDILSIEEMVLEDKLCEGYGIAPYGQVLTLLPHANLDSKSFPANVLEGSVITGGEGLRAKTKRVGRFISKIKKPYGKP
jgi:hypothetical protein